MHLNEVAKKYEQAIQSVANQKQVEQMAQQLHSYSEDELRAAAIEDERVGRIIFVDSPEYPNEVLEVIAGTIAADMVLTLYTNNAIFANRTQYIHGRLELIKEVSKVLGGGENYSQVAINDSARGRAVLLCELSTAQLMDILTDSERRILV